MQDRQTSSLTAKDVLTSIGEIDKLGTVQSGWEDSAQAITSPPSCLEANKLEAYWPTCGFVAPVPELLKKTATRILANPALLRFFEHTLWRTFEGTSEKWYEDWPKLERALGQEACGVFYLILALELVPRLRQRHNSLGIQENVTRDTVLQVSCFCKNYQMGKNGRLGIYLSQLAWLEKYTTNRLFRLGRLEFWAKPFHGAISAYRNRQTGETIAMASDGSHFTKDGFRKSNPSEQDLGEGWTATLIQTDTAVTGCPISPRGMALREKRTLPFAEWECVLQKDSPILEMHIPAGGGLTPEFCADSFHRAKEFFDERYPDFNPRAISCSSWLFNTQLQEIFPNDANLPTFQRQLYLYPVPSSGEDSLWFIFFQEPFDMKTAPRNTRLQRAILDFLSKGNTWRGGAMFFLLDDLPRFGTEHYLQGKD